MKCIKEAKTIDTLLKKYNFESHFSFPIRPYLMIVEYEKEEFIIRNTSHLTRILFLAQGTAKLYAFHPNGRQSLINFFKATSLFGAPELFDGSKRPFPLAAHTKCLFIEIDTKCRSQLLKDPLFLRFCCDMAFKQDMEQHRRYLNLTAYPSKNNFAACLLLLQNNGIFSMKYTEIAEYLSISYRHLMHLISEMCDEEILERVPGGVKILDWPAVQTLADEINEENFL